MMSFVRNKFLKFYVLPIMHRSSHRIYSKGNKNFCLHGAYRSLAGERRIKKYMSKIESMSKAIGTMKNKIRQKE